MKPSDIRDPQMKDLFGGQLENFINMKHAIVQLSKSIDWERLEREFIGYYKDFGRPGLPIRMMVGLHILKHVYGVSDEAVCAAWEENPYYQYFCGEVYFQHRFPVERSSLTHFRNRVGMEALEKLLQESLAVAYKAGKLRLKDLQKVAVDTTVQCKAISHPTEHSLLLRAGQKLRDIASLVGVKLRQTYTRVLKRAAQQVGRYIHAKQMKRAKRVIQSMRVRVKRMIRDLGRKIEDKLETMPHHLRDQVWETFSKAQKVADQKRGDPGYLYAWHAPEVECISKGKARAPYEFGCKVSLATNLQTGKGGKHFILHAQALHGNPYDGHTLQRAITQMTEIIGHTPHQVVADRGYKGHKIKEGPQVYLSGQKRGVTKQIKKDLKRRSVIEPIIGHAKNDGLMGRNYLKGRKGDQINALLAAIGFNFRQLLASF